jgi:hypothetical protein
MNAVTEWFLALLDEVGAEPRGNDRIRQCPAHRDSTPSLSISTGETGVVMITCHAGCTPRQIIDSLHLNWLQLRNAPTYPPSRHVRNWRLKVEFPPVDLRPGGSPSSRGMRLESVHDYGDHVLERWRHPVNTTAKDLLWFTRTSAGRIPGLLGVPTRDLALYMERQIRMAVAAGELVYVVESESSVDALTRHGLYATTWAGGAASPALHRLQTVLDGGHVVLVPDNDEPGIECARRIHAVLEPVTTQLDIILPPSGQDARDLLATNGIAAFTPTTEGGPT